jgi:hypothetical protein
LAGDTPRLTKKGTGFVQPLAAHEHWHVDVSYLNVAGTFYFLCSVLDGFSRFIVHHEIREKMEESDVEIILQRARETYSDARPRIITDNGPQFLAREFKEFIRLAGMTHVKTSPYYPQSNGKIERWHKTLKSESIRPRVPLSLEEARRIVAEYVRYYNTVRLNGAIGYLTPQDMLAGRAAEIFATRDQKLAAAREERQRRRQAERATVATPVTPATPRPPIDFAALRTMVSLNAVLELLGFHPQTRAGAQWRGPCPLHGATTGTSRCFSANVEQGLFHCFQCGRHGNALDLWAAALRLPPYEAALHLAARLGLALPTLPTTANREEEPVANSDAHVTIPAPLPHTVSP